MTEHVAELIEAAFGPQRPLLDVGNAAVMAEWLREELGRGPLAGMFARGDRIVHTPREGEDGYVPLTNADGDDDGPAQVHVATPDYIAARVQLTYSCYRTVKVRGEDKQVPAMFPVPAARTACNAVDLLLALRRLRGVVHTPVLRPDGSLISKPGYDAATKLLHLPEPGLVVPAVPDHPSTAELRQAVALVGRMVADFPFVTDHDRANYLGLLLTPLLRTIVGPPYKLGAIQAHERGSGKTLLANLIRAIHGGVFRAELPEDDAELRKQVSTILDVTTGPVVVLDNVSGVLRSSVLSGLLTAAHWDDRKLGTMEQMISRPNDRLWIITGNNLTIGGDLPRRTLRVTIDPRTPRPQDRTGFAIPDLEDWVRRHRGELLAALLTIVRSWVVAGQPGDPWQPSDSYRAWVRTVGGILEHAGIPGGFDHRDIQIEVGHDDEEWTDFLAAIHRVHGDGEWSCRQLLDSVLLGFEVKDKTDKELEGRLTPDHLPSAFTRPTGAGWLQVTVSIKSLGRWLANRQGRWAGGLTVREAGRDAHSKVQRWRIEKAGHRA